MDTVKIIQAELDRFNQVLFPKQGSFNWTDKNIKAVKRFIEVLNAKKFHGPSIGSSWMYRYLCFQYEYWMNLDTNLKKGVQLTWIIGQKAVERYIDRPFSDMTKCVAVMKDLGLHPKATSTYNQTSPRFEVTIKSKSSRKGDVSALIECAEFTTMYDPNNAHCITCNMKTECQLQLQSRYPKIFIARGLKPVK